MRRQAPRMLRAARPAQGAGRCGPLRPAAWPRTVGALGAKTRPASPFRAGKSGGRARTGADARACKICSGRAVRTGARPCGGRPDRGTCQGRREIKPVLPRAAATPCETRGFYAPAPDGTGPDLIRRDTASANPAVSSAPPMSRVPTPDATRPAREDSKSAAASAQD